MPNNDRKFSILRWINYKHTDLSQLNKSIRYICSPKSTAPEFCRYSNIRKDRAIEDFQIIEKRWRNEIHGRLYKHCIISFGAADILPGKAFQVMEEVFSLYRGTYPYVFSIHTNIPHRIHGHCIMGMTNLLTGKRFSQSPQELTRFQTHYQEVMLRANLPPLKGWQSAERPTGIQAAIPQETIWEDSWEPSDEDWKDEELSDYCSDIPVDSPVSIPNVMSCADTLSLCEQLMEENYHTWFEFAIKLKEETHHE